MLAGTKRSSFLPFICDKLKKDLQPVNVTANIRLNHLLLAGVKCSGFLAH
jgi:hypothetical protein